MAENAANPAGSFPTDTARRLLIRLAVVCTCLIFGACTTVLIYRSTTIEVPEAVLIVRGSPQWDGIAMSVDGMRRARPTVVSFDKGTKYTIAFHLVPGDYTLSARSAGKVIFEQHVELSRQVKSKVVYLPNSPAGLAPTSQPTWPQSIDAPWLNASSMTPMTPTTMND